MRQLAERYQLAQLSHMRCFCIQSPSSLQSLTPRGLSGALPHNKLTHSSCALHTSSQFIKASAMSPKPGKLVSTTVLIVHVSFPPALSPLVARPTIWLYSTKDFVGLAITAALVSGASNPVVNTPKLHITIGLLDLRLNFLITLNF